MTWPEYHQAIRGIAVDGHGHIYVFPWATDDESGASVDVYSQHGELLFSGVLSGSWSAEHGPWAAAHADYVYDVVRNDSDDNYVAKRWRLVEPF